MASAPVLAPLPADDLRPRHPRALPSGVLAGLILAALWIIAGGIGRLTGSDVVITRLLSFVGVGPLQVNEWMLPGLWTLATLLGAAAVLTSVTWFVAERAHGGRRPFVALWFAAIIASTVLGLCVDLTRALTYLADFGVRGATAVVVEVAPVAAYWGVVSGWIPALLVFRRVQPDGPRPRAWPAIVAVLVSAMLLVVVSSLADAARQQQIIQENAEAQGLTEEGGAFPDPTAEGDPVPAVAPGVSAPELEPEWCTSDKAMLLLGGSDAATGHRGQVIHLMNFSDEPCVVEGYPDIAFADQNGNLLDVEVLPGSSFMAADPGVARITVPAQGQAMSVIGWDANATDGALVARQLYAAPIPGLERGSWPVELDVVAGSGVEVTAWTLDAGVTAP